MYKSNYWWSSWFTIERNERTLSAIKKSVVDGDEGGYSGVQRECHLTVSQAGTVDSVSFYTVRFSYGIIALLLPGVGHCWSSLAEREKVTPWQMRPLSTGLLYGNLVCSSDENPDNFVVCTRLQYNILVGCQVCTLCNLNSTRINCSRRATPRRKHLLSRAAEYGINCLHVHYIYSYSESRCAC